MNLKFTKDWQALNHCIKQVIMVNYVMMMGTMLKNGKEINISTLYVIISSKNGNQMEKITWGKGNTNVALHIVNLILMVITTT